MNRKSLKLNLTKITKERTTRVGRSQILGLNVREELIVKGVEKKE